MDLSLVFEACVAAITLMITAGVCASLGRWVVREATGAEEFYVGDEEERAVLEEHRRQKTAEKTEKEEKLLEEWRKQKIEEYIQQQNRIERGWDAGLR